MLSISNYYRRKVNQNSKKSNHASQNGHSKRSTDNKCSRQLERDVTAASPTRQSVRWTLATATERRVSACQGKKKKNLSKELILGSDIPTSAHIFQKDTCTSTLTSALLTGAKKQIQANVHWQIKEKVVRVYSGLLLSPEKPPLKLWHRSLQGWTLEDHKLSEVSENKKGKRIWYPYRQKFLNTWGKII